ncbi:MAG: hypothetical protein NVSMB52_05880 [Chloroflexota bacterium]
MYRAVRDSLEKLRGAQQHLTTGILAEDTRSISTESSVAMAIVDGTISGLREELNHPDEGESTGDTRVNHQSVQAAVAALNRAWNSAEKVGLGANVHDMRGHLLDFKTHVDYAAAYLLISVGNEEM